MFIEDIHIFWYVGFGLLGLLVGRLLGLVNQNLSEHKKIFSEGIVKDYLKNTNPQYFVMILVSILYIALLRIVGIDDQLKFLQFLILIPMLVSAFLIDYKLQIIPNRLTLTMWEVGVVSSFLRGINNINIAIEMWLGMIVGAGIFLILTYLGNLIFKKETMGFGDVKLMGALGLYFGWRGIIVISILSFLIAAVFCLVLIIVKKVKKETLSEFIPFGPFIVLASFVVIYVPTNLLIELPFIIFTLGKYRAH